MIAWKSLVLATLGPLVPASTGITDDAGSGTIPVTSAQPQRNQTYRPSSYNNRHKPFNLPSFSLAHTTHMDCKQKSGSSSAPPTPGYTHYPSFLPIPAGLAHWAILTGLSVVRGKSRPRQPRWYGMGWCWPALFWKRTITQVCCILSIWYRHTILYKSILKWIINSFCLAENRLNDKNTIICCTANHTEVKKLRISSILWERDQWVFFINTVYS